MNDAVARPSHYVRGEVEIADVIDAFDLGRWEADAVEYIVRAALKNDGANEGQDVAKAIAKLIRALMVKSPATLEGFCAFGFRLVKEDGAAEARPKRCVPREPGVLERVLLDDALDLYGSTFGRPIREAFAIRRARFSEGELDAGVSVAAALGPLPKDDPFTRFIVEMAEIAAERRSRAERRAAQDAAE